MIELRRERLIVDRQDRRTLALLGLAQSSR
jgi:hypothetical protein